MQILPEGKTELLTSEVTRDAYPLATYFHAKQSYFILGWRETGGETVTTARHVPQRETRPITRSGATLTLLSPAFLGWATWNTAPMPRRWPGSGSSAAPCANRAAASGGRFTTTGRASPR